MSTLTSRRLTRLAALPVAGVALVGLVACGSGTTTTTSGSTASSGTPSAGTTSDDSAFRTCLEQNGVTAPAGTGEGRTPPSGASGAGGTPPAGAPHAGAGQPGSRQAPPGVDADTWAAARAACADLAPAVPSGPAAN
jgi:hypothetical protein